VIQPSGFPRKHWYAASFVMRAIFRRAVTAALMVSLTAPATAAASAPGRHGVTDPEALAHLDAAESAFKIGDYEKATVHFKAAYAVEQRPELLYAWAQVERLAGNYRVAAGLYEAFLKESPDSGSAGEARAHMIEMRALAGDDPEAVEPEPEEPEPATEQTEPPPDEEDTNAPLKGEWIAPTLLGAGAAIAIAGGVMLALGRSQAAESAGAPSEQAYFTELGAGRTLYYAGAATLGVGGPVMVGGVIRYAWVARRGGKPEPKQTQTTAVVTRSGFGLSLGGRF
jgi:tetratricopeptide (TPR) repeat protein